MYSTATCIFLVISLSFTSGVKHSDEVMDDNWTYDMKSHVESMNSHLTNIIALRESNTVTLTDELKILRSQLQNPNLYLESTISSVNGNVSDTCSSQVMEIAKSPLLFAAVLDSWGKPEAGFFQGNIKWQGDFDECINMTSSGFDTRYCTLSLSVKGPYNTNIQVGACVPRGCRSEDVKVLIDTALQSNTTGVLCKPLPSERPWYGGNTAALFFVMLMVGICCLATIYDVILMLLESRLRSSKTDTNDSITERTPLIADSHTRGSQPPVSKQSLLSRVILSFSFYSNACKLLDTTQPPGTITSLNGIRFFSMSWVILGHCLGMFSFSQMKNTLWILEVLNRWTFQPILNATVSVDTFFVLSGFLVAYLLLKDFNKRKIQTKGFFKAIPMIYLQRYFRLTPAYGFMIIIYSCLMYYMWDGPNWPYNKDYPTTVDPNCPKYWYLAILYVNNIFYADKPCAGWGWYLSNDFQFFLIAPFIAFIFYINEILGLLTGVLTIVGSVIAATVVSDEQRYSITFPISPSSHRQYETLKNPNHYPEYFVPWTRYQTYGIGLVAGLVFYKLKMNNYKIPPLLNLFLWGLSGGMCLSYLYGTYDANTGGHWITLGEVDAYNGLGRTAWGIAVSYFIISCALGQGGWVNRFLSWKGFILLSRLTYCSYLIHIPILQALAGFSRNGSFYTDVNLVKDFLVVLVLAMGLAFPFSLIFEIPFINLDKIFLAPLSIKRHRKIEEKSLNVYSNEGEDPSSEPSPPHYGEIDKQGGAQA